MGNQASGKSVPTGGVNESGGASYSDVKHDEARDLGSGSEVPPEEASEQTAPVADEPVPNYYEELGQKHLRTGEAGNKDFFPDPRDLPHPWAESGAAPVEPAQPAPEEKPGGKKAA